MNVMRFTIVDENGTVSFVADCAALPLFVSGCAEGASRLEDLLTHVARRQPNPRELVENGLAVFHEHNVPGGAAAIHGALRFHQPHDAPVFRVLDERTRQASLQPIKAGVIVFNPRSRRIIQIQNTCSEIRRMAGKARRLELSGWRILR